MFTYLFFFFFRKKYYFVRFKRFILKQIFVFVSFAAYQESHLNLDLLFLFCFEHFIHLFPQSDTHPSLQQQQQKSKQAYTNNTIE